MASMVWEEKRIEKQTVIRNKKAKIKMTNSGEKENFNTPRFFTIRLGVF